MSNTYIPSISAEAVLSRSGAVRLVDVRKLAAAEASGKMVAGAAYIDPFALRFEHSILQGSEPIVFYCVHGHEVSMFACAMARVAGCEAAYVEGGFVALTKAGAELVAFDGGGA